MCPVVSRFDAKRQRRWSQEVLSDGIPTPCHCGERRTGCRRRTARAFRVEKPLSQWSARCCASVGEPLDGVRFGAIADGSSQVGNNIRPLLLCMNREGEPIRSDAGVRQGQHGSEEPCRSESLYRVASQISADFAIACVVERTRESVDAAGRIVLDMALSIWTC